MQEKEQSTITDAHFRHLNAYRDDPAYSCLISYDDRVAFFERRVGTRWEIDAAIYEEFLDLLPPLGYRADSFYLSEFLFDGITHRFSREGGRFFCEVAFYPPRPKGQPLSPAREPKA